MFCVFKRIDMKCLTKCQYSIIHEIITKLSTLRCRKEKYNWELIDFLMGLDKDRYCELLSHNSLQIGEKLFSGSGLESVVSLYFHSNFSPISIPCGGGGILPCEKFVYPCLTYNQSTVNVKIRRNPQIRIIS